MIESPRPKFLHLVLFAAAYLVCLWLGHWLMLTPGSAATLWPPSGLYVAVLLLSDKRRWPFWALAGLPAELAGDWWLFQLPPFAALAIYLGNTLEAAVGAELVRRRYRSPFRLTRPGKVLAFAIFGAIVGPAIGAVIGAATLDLIDREPFAAAWPNWWSGDGAGVMIVAPLIIALFEIRKKWRETGLTRFGEAAALLAGMVLAAHLVFGGYFPFGYLLLLPLLWATLRFEIPGAAFATFILAIMATRYSASGLGLFASPDLDPSKRQCFLQLWLIVFALSGLIVATIARQHRLALVAFKRTNEELEARVSERTAELRKSEERLRLAQHIGDVALWGWDAQTGEFYGARETEQLYGLTPGSIRSYEDWATQVDRDDLARIEGERDAALAAGEPFRIEFRVRRDSGANRWIAARGMGDFDADGHVRRVLGVNIDITERKLAEDELRLTLDRLKLAQRAAGAGAWDWNIRTGRMVWSPELFRLFGLDPDVDTAGLEAWRRVVHPADLARAEARIAATIEDRVQLQSEYRIVPPEGGVRWIHALGATEYDEAGQATSMAGICLDITERKEIEQSLRHLQEELALILDATPAMIWYKDTGNRILRVNATAANSIGLAKEEIEGRPSSDFYPEEADRYHQDDLIVAETGLPRLGIEEPYRLPSGELRWIRTDKIPLKDESGRVTRILVMSMDITEQTRALAALRESEERLRLAQSSAQLGIWDWQLENGKLSWTPELERIYGYLEGSFPENYEAFHERVHPDDLADVERRRDEAVAALQPFDYDFRIRTVAGETRWVNCKGSAVYDEAGNPTRILGVNIDITARKLAEHELGETNQRLRALMNALPVGVSFSDDATCRRIFGNPAILAQYEASPSDNLSASAPAPEDYGRRVRYFTDGRPVADHELPLQRAMTENREIPPTELEVHLPSGRRWFMSASAAPIADEHGKVIGGVVVTQDITSRKQFEERLRESEETFRAMFEVSSVGKMEADPVTGRFLRVNAAYCRLTGYSEFELLERTFLDITHPQDRAADQELKDRFVRADAPTFQRETRYVRPDGTIVWAEVTMNVIRDQAELPVRLTGVVQDITERRRIENELRQKREDLDRAQAVGQIGSWRLDLRDNVVTWSDQTCRIFGVPRDEPMTYGTFLQMVHPDDRGYVDTQWMAGLAGVPYDVEHRILVSGEVKWVREKAYLEFDESGQAISAFGITQDITERKRAEEALHISEERLRLALSGSDTAMWDWGIQTGHVFWSPEHFALLAYDPENMAPSYEAWATRVHPDDRAATEAAIQASMRDGREYRREYRIVLPGGSVRWIEARGNFSFNADGTPERMLGVMNDITERKRVEEALQQSELRERRRASELETILDTAPIGLALAPDASGLHILGNRANERLFGQAPGAEFSKAAPAPASFRVFEYGRELELLDLPMQRAVRGETVTGQVLDILGEDGRKRTVYANAAPLFDEAARPRGAVGAFLDISPLKEAEQALREADRRKDEFLAMLAHELRNPLAPIRNALHVLRKIGPPDPNAERLFEMLERQTNHLVRLVDDLLEVSRISRGKIELRKEPCDLSAIIGNAVETSQPVIETANLSLQVSLPPTPLPVEADPVRLAQVFANLFDNAVKYTEPGGQISIAANRLGGEAVVSIRDTGVGIPPDMLPRVFDLFTQIDRSLGRSKGGLGIGLALVRSLVELHGGRVEAHSEGVGRGSEFVVRLPLGGASASDASKQALPVCAPVAAGRILVVDDNQDAADSLSLLLKGMGADLRVAYDGPTALELLDSFKPDFVFLDLGMPEMDGFETARRIRQHPDGRDLTLVALTGWGQEEDLRRTREAGFDQHMVKPANLDRLQTLLALSTADTDPSRMPQT